ncbi:CDP-alcohol phosphatidyltransferase family protein [Phycicoccus endophyticus]|uniref:CDP-alcohol phosphatidyltransferase family protein n=1 Tax=Phycicoccus endophyticus TaxID=1690220 RepID=A0A7G9R4N4_9MICO|nr:CDP-alcohol phosphatidyltransferase family protein [Phycicoccus endophyticus]NHI18458.1 CDP-alcohol phosphatidyltransferase family protein [Phycicoccus endophyticus]QNN50559.1 CDP-alcohol phosphatidyltransferase family protein [Phycicoccus endophyticus]GGL23620.1 CDP-diacylglycerol--glycerol-3-phosphate 3-phosphatidyltransferase [Phycicoccus endophyticus]
MVAQDSSGAVSTRVLTLPNLLSALRLVGVPVFLWAVLSGHDALAIVLLAVSGATDYLDGRIARAWGQESRLGQLLDPVADRLYIASTLFGLAVRDVIPWWVVGVLLAREAFMGVVVLVAKRHGWLGLPVHLTGKAATFNLLYAFPLLLLADGDSPVARVAEPIGWGFAWWGIVLYWLAGLLYAAQLRRLLAHERTVLA